MNLRLLITTVAAAVACAALAAPAGAQLDLDPKSERWYRLELSYTGRAVHKNIGVAVTDGASFGEPDDEEGMISAIEWTARSKRDFLLRKNGRGVTFGASLEGIWGTRQISNHRRLVARRGDPDRPCRSSTSEETLRRPVKLFGTIAGYPVSNAKVNLTVSLENQNERPRSKLLAFRVSERLGERINRERKFISNKVYELRGGLMYRSISGTYRISLIPCPKGGRRHCKKSPR
jgi:hypothetical protein